MTAFILCFGFSSVVEIYLMLGFILIWLYFLSWWHGYIFEVYVIFRCDVSCWDILCMSSWWIIRRRDVNFLIIYYNCVIYRFNRNRVLQVGIRAMSVMSGPKPGELPVVFEWYIDLPSILVVMFCCCSRCMRYVRKYYRYLFRCFFF